MRSFTNYLHYRFLFRTFIVVFIAPIVHLSVFCLLVLFLLVTHTHPYATIYLQSILEQQSSDVRCCFCFFKPLLLFTFDSWAVPYEYWLSPQNGAGVSDDVPFGEYKILHPCVSRSHIPAGRSWDGKWGATLAKWKAPQDGNSQWSWGCSAAGGWGCNI